MTIARTALIGLAAAAGIASAAPAQERVVTERSLTERTGWWQLHNVSPDRLSALIREKRARIVDLEVNSTGPLRVSAALVANRGPHASGWWWYYGLDAAGVSERLRRNNARLIDMDVYRAGGRTRFAVVMKRNTGAEAVGWWWWYGQTPAQLAEKARARGARIIDIERYEAGGRARYAAIMVRNSGRAASGWWWYHGQTAGQVSQRIAQHGARLLDIERYRTSRGDRYAIVLSPNRGGASIRWWWYHGVSAQSLLEAARRHSARLVDIAPPRDGGRGYVGVMVDNGMVRSGDCGGRMRSVDRAVVDWMKRHNVPGGSAAVIKDGRLVYACAFGYADVATGERVTPAHRFRLASISKPITLSAIRKLEADGALSLSDRMLDRLGSARPAGPYADDRLGEVTIAHLMNHEGGWNLREMGFDPMFHSRQIASALGTPLPTGCRRVIRYMFQRAPLSFDPGEGLGEGDYSNFGYCLLGRIVEAASGRSYERYVREEILAPAGITRMRIGRSLAAARFPQEVRHHDRMFARTVASVFPGARRVPSPEGGFNVEAMDANGGWIATAVDTARFADRAAPQPWGGNWAFEGGMDGTRTRVDKRGDVVMAVLFNTRPVKDLDTLVTRALDGVRSWPTVDLSSRHDAATTRETRRAAPVIRVERPVRRIERPGFTIRRATER